VLSTGSPGLYRPFGWEVAGSRGAVTIPGRALADLGPAAGQLVREPSSAERSALTGGLAAGWDGAMLRPAWWEELTEAWLGARPAQRVGCREDGRLTGWLAMERDEGTLVVSEWWTGTPDAVTGLAGFLGAGRPHPIAVRFDTGALPPDAELLHRPRSWEVEGGSSVSWMQRLTDPAAALAARGWPPGIELRAELEVVAGRRPAERLVLEIGGGEAAVTAGGAGTVRAGAGALAAWYAGGLRLRRAAALGWVTGPEPVLAALDAATGDRVAWLPERF
jgi:predicted acetyltransferase